MINPLFGSNYKYDPTSGEFIHAKHRELHGVIQRFWPQWKLVWIPKNQRVTAEEIAKPFALVDQFDRVLMWFSEADMDRPDMVLARIWESDSSKHPAGYMLNKLEQMELAQLLLDEQKFKETMEEKREIATAILRSPKNVYKHAGVTYRS
jgi:hypothetical protein